MECEDCKGTGIMSAQSINLSRPYYDKSQKGLVCDVTPIGEFEEMKCHCQEDD